MADVKNIITLGIGAEPGSIHFFVLVGLDVGVQVPVPLTLPSRSTSPTLKDRSTDLTVSSRSTSLTLEDIR